MTATQTFMVGNSIAALAMKAPCVVVTNAAIVLEGEQTVNSVAVVTGDRVLVKDQADSIENGVYVVSTSGWQRAVDFAGNSNAINGTLVHVVIPSVFGSGDFWATGFWATDFWADDFWAGSAGATASLYSLSATDPVRIGTSALAFNLMSF